MASIPLETAEMILMLSLKGRIVFSTRLISYSSSSISKIFISDFEFNI